MQLGRRIKTGSPNSRTNSSGKELPKDTKKAKKIWKFQHLHNLHPMQAQSLQAN